MSLHRMKCSVQNPKLYKREHKCRKYAPHFTCHWLSFQRTKLFTRMPPSSSFPFDALHHFLEDSMGHYPSLCMEMGSKKPHQNPLQNPSSSQRTQSWCEDHDFFNVPCFQIDNFDSKIASFHQTLVLLIGWSQTERPLSNIHEKSYLFEVELNHSEAKAERIHSKSHPLKKLKLSEAKTEESNSGFHEKFLLLTQNSTILRPS